MKISFLVSSLTHGGAERVASLWANGFVERGYDVSCIIMTSSTPISYELSPQVRVCRVRAEGSGILNNIKQLSQLRGYLKILKPEILITVLHPLSLFGYISSIGMGIKIINTEHNTFDRPPYSPLSQKERFYKFTVNKLFDKVTIFTQADINFINGRLNNIAYLPNPLSMTPLSSIPKKNNVILAVGRMEAWHVKGFDLLIDAWSQIANNYIDWKLQIMGGGDDAYKKELIERAKKTGLINRIEFIGFNDNPRHYFADASIFVLSSRYEGFGMVLLEAMSQGCACIACDYKGRQKEILNSKKVGITCQSNSVDDLKKSLEYMLDNKYYRESIRMDAIERAKEYSLDKIIDKWEDILSAI